MCLAHRFHFLLGTFHLLAKLGLLDLNLLELGSGLLPFLAKGCGLIQPVENCPA
jgi:hypothetical protein